MRLLNSCTWEMREFISQPPPYAILSHTWGDEEISWREWEDKPLGVIGKKKGFSKINYCCQQAASDGLAWVWIDTCCIDKSSSSELSESINSMFRWYKDASVCYAYLCDVFELNNVESRLAGSRWVTRGWTLQELIAPSKLIFYTSNWQPLGTRSQLLTCITTITRIDRCFLTGEESLDKASIAQRMSWAANRMTSRKEDQAYCLLGIFNVNMPLIYGEGEKAFRRLQELLIHEYPEDHSVFAWGRIVKELSNRISDEEQTWGTKPIKYEPGRNIEEALPGLLAESPADFKDSNLIVRAPMTSNYFVYDPIMSVPTLVGRSVALKIPIRTYVDSMIALHIKRPRVVILLAETYLITLCGQWDESHTRFHHVGIPLLGYYASEASRSYELVVSDKFSQEDPNPGPGCSAGQLNAMIGKCFFTPELLSSPQNGDLVIRRVISKFSYVFIQAQATVLNRYGVANVQTWVLGVVLSVDYSISENEGFRVTLARPSPLQHTHENPDEGRGCGRLRLGFYHFIRSQQGNTGRPVTIISENGTGDNATREKVAPLTFKTNYEEQRYGATHWQGDKYNYDVVNNRDKWRIRIVGVADLYMSVERMFMGDEDSRDDTPERGCHSFVDVLDIVVKEDREVEEKSKEAHSWVRGWRKRGKELELGS